MRHDWQSVRLEFNQLEGDKYIWRCHNCGWELHLQTSQDPSEDRTFKMKSTSGDIELTCIEIIAQNVHDS